jgi:hypothetical protein
VAYLILQSSHGQPGIGLAAGQPGFESFRHRFQAGSGAHSASYGMCTRGCFPVGKSDGSMKLTTPLHLELRLRMCGAIPPLPHTSS